MKKTVWIPLLFIILILSGCAHEGFGITLNEDGTGSIVAVIGIEKNSADQLTALGADPFDGKEPVTYYYGGKTYLGFTREAKYSSTEELKKALEELTFDTLLRGNLDDYVNEEIQETENTPVFRDVSIRKQNKLFRKIYSFSAVLNPCSVGNIPDLPFSADVICSVSVTLPGRITETNGVIQDTQTAVFETNGNVEAELTAVSSQTDWISVFTVTALLIALIVGAVITVKGGSSKA